MLPLDDVIIECVLIGDAAFAYDQVLWIQSSSYWNNPFHEMDTKIVEKMTNIRGESRRKFRHDLAEEYHEKNVERYGQNTGNVSGNAWNPQICGCTNDHSLM